MEVTFELEWVVYVSRPAGEARTGVCFMAPGLEHQIPEHRTAYSGSSLILTFQVDDARRELDASARRGSSPTWTSATSPGGSGIS